MKIDPLDCSVVGWRVFRVGDRGELIPPFVRKYWPESGQSAAAWGGPGEKAYWLTVAHCSAGADHAAPAEDCTCGLRATEDLSELLAAVTERRFDGSDSSILDECGVLARVWLSGRILPGVNMPNDDPHGTSRASQAQVLDLHLAPGMERHAGTLEDRYGVAVVTYSPDEWPHAAAYLAAATRSLPPDESTRIPTRPTKKQKAAFCNAIRPLGFGTKSTAQPEQFLTLALDAVATMRDGVTSSDIRSALFDSDAHPSERQVRGLISAAVEHLAPDLADAPDGAVFAAPVPRKSGLALALEAASGR